MQPGELASLLKSGHPAPTVICTAFPVLYRQRHILHAKLAGPGSKPEGIEELRKLVAGLPKNTDLVLYCGCCPMDRCPNIRPAYQALKDLGFTHIRVLSMPTNFHTDWIILKGLPGRITAWLDAVARALFADVHHVLRRLAVAFDHRDRRHGIVRRMLGQPGEPAMRKSY